MNEVARGSVLTNLIVHGNEEYGILTVYIRTKGMVPPSTERGMRGRGAAPAPAPAAQGAGAIDPSAVPGSECRVLGSVLNRPRTHTQAQEHLRTRTRTHIRHLEPWFSSGTSVAAAVGMKPQLKPLSEQVLVDYRRVERHWADDGRDGRRRRARASSCPLATKPICSRLSPGFGKSAAAHSTSSRTSRIPTPSMRIADLAD